MTADDTRRPRRRRVRTIVLVGVGVGAVVVATLAAAGFYSYGLKPPEFESLQDQPDESLHGTVAFYADGCVRIIAASGSVQREVMCFGEEAGNGPQLAWREDGRLEITTFDWPTGGDLAPGWQKLVDVETGDVEEVPATQLPDKPAPRPVPAIGPNGEEVTASREVSGWPVQRSRMTVVIDEAGRSRTLMSGSGNPDYRAEPGGEPVWSPSGDWIVMIDGRLLLITTGEDPQARVLVESPSGVGGWVSAGIRTFAATDADLLAGDS